MCATAVACCCAAPAPSRCCGLWTELSAGQAGMLWRCGDLRDLTPTRSGSASCAIGGGVTRYLDAGRRCPSSNAIMLLVGSWYAMYSSCSSAQRRRAGSRAASAAQPHVVHPKARRMHPSPHRHRIASGCGRIGRAAADAVVSSPDASCIQLVASANFESSSKPAHPRDPSIWTQTRSR